MVLFTKSCGEKPGVSRACFEPRYETEANKCMFLIFHIQRKLPFVLSLAFIMRFTTTRKWLVLLANFRREICR